MSCSRCGGPHELEACTMLDGEVKVLGFFEDDTYPEPTPESAATFSQLKLDLAEMLRQMREIGTTPAPVLDWELMTDSQREAVRQLFRDGAHKREPKPGDAILGVQIINVPPRLGWQPQLARELMIGLRRSGKREATLAALKRKAIDVYGMPPELLEVERTSSIVELRVLEREHMRRTLDIHADGLRTFFGRLGEALDELATAAKPFVDELMRYMPDELPNLDRYQKHPPRKQRAPSKRCGRCGRQTVGRCCR